MPQCHFQPSLHIPYLLILNKQQTILVKESSKKETYREKDKKEKRTNPYIFQTLLIQMSIKTWIVTGRITLQSPTKNNYNKKIQKKLSYKQNTHIWNNLSFRRRLIWIIIHIRKLRTLDIIQIIVFRIIRTR